MFFSFDDFELDVENQALRRTGRLVPIDGLVLRLLSCLVRNAGRQVTKDQLVDEVWQGRAIADNAITVSIARLRKVLGHRPGEPEYIATIYGRGYRFTRDVAMRDKPSRPVVVPEVAHEVVVPFVGRERTLNQLRRGLNDARAGRGGACVLMGEPGIGKTRAVEALERELAGSGVHVAWGYCREAGDTPPLWPWLRMLREVLDASEAARREADANGTLQLRELVISAGASSSEEVDAVLKSWSGGGRHQHFDAMLRTLITAAEDSALLLVIDDLHRADAASLELLGQLLDEISRTRIFVVATMRHGAGGAARSATRLPYVLGHRNCDRVVLERLAEADVMTYVAALLDDRSGELGRAVFQKSEGNPFFMGELARSLRDAGPNVSAAALAVPHQALDLIRQRVAGLAPNVRSLLSHAAVIGRSFELPMLAAVTAREPSELMGLLDEAIEAELVVAAPGSLTAFAFGHELLRGVLYDALPPAQQRSWHLRTAQVLEQRWAAGDHVPPSELAYHFHAALPQSDLRKTVQFCRAAANAAATVFANIDVVRYARHALEALELMERPSVRLRMRLLYTIALCARGHAWLEAGNATRELARLAREHGDAMMLLGAARVSAAHPGFQPLPGVDIRDALERVQGLLRPDASAWLAIVRAALAGTAPDCYDAERAEAQQTEALALCRASGSRTAMYPVLALTLYTHGGPDHERNASELAQELELLGQREPGQTPTLCVDLAFHQAVRALRRGDSSSLDSVLERASQRCRELRHAELLWHCERFTALTKLQRGAWLDGARELMAVHRRAEQGRITGTAPFVAFDRAVSLADLGQARPPDSELRAALRYEASDPPSIWSLKLRAAASCGWLSEARAALYTIAPASLAKLPCDRDILGTLGHLARAALILDAGPYISALYGLLGRYADGFAAGVAFYSEGSVQQLLGMLGAGRVASQAVVAHYEAGIGANERAGLALRAIEARMQLARFLANDAAQSAQRRSVTLAREAGAAASRIELMAQQREAEALVLRVTG
ncbi:MAG TPA: AAA family ATPase [Polyangiales bacterium]|nr:AAA family ATPase [Polyangiales bacterium]